MCEPATIVMAVTAIAGAAMSAQQQRQQGQFQKGVAEYNAQVAENEATETRNKGTEEENKQRRRTAELLSKQRAQLGASGIELGSGSALQLQEDTETLGEVDALRIRSNFSGRAGALDTSAGLTRTKGGFAEEQGRSAATGTLLSGVAGVAKTGVADKWFTPKSAASSVTPTTNAVPRQQQLSALGFQ